MQRQLENITIGKNNSLFFFILTHRFVRHQFATTTSPVILWLNGGPGCSSLGGLIEELGPFHVSDNGNTVYENIWAWNKVHKF